VVELTTRDQQVLGLRLAGVSTRKIARELKIGDKEVIAALDRKLPVVDAS
jgi:transcriptional regulator